MERLNQSRRWRGVLLAVLCALAYFVSFDHGRDSLRPRISELDRQKEELREETDRLRAELVRLSARLADCPTAPADSGQQPGRISLKANQSKTLFGNRLLLYVPDIDRESGRVFVQLNFVPDNRQISEELTVGGSLPFSLDGRDWALVVAGLTLTTANFNLMEIKSAP